MRQKMFFLHPEEKDKLTGRAHDMKLILCTYCEPILGIIKQNMQPARWLMFKKEEKRPPH